MDFSWTDEQLAFKSRVMKFARESLDHDVEARDHASQFSRENWQKCADFGLLGLSVPGTYSDGRDIEFLTAMLAMEGMGYACPDNGLTFALNAQMWTVQLPIVHFGSEQQKKTYLPAMCRGDQIGAHVITEPHSGSDVYSLKTHAQKCEEGYRLNGSKRFISLAPVADIALVFATIDPQLGKWGITAFLVDCASKGVHRGPVKEKMGLRTVPMSDITFKDCIVPEANRLGPEGSGMSLSTSSLEWERCCILASQIGAMERQLEIATDYAKNRQQFGQTIGKFQSVSGRIVDMKLRLETARLLLYKVAWLKSTGQPAMTEAALLKLYLGECFVQSSLDAIQVHGGLGYMTESGIERDLRDAIGGTIYAGTSDIQRNIVATLLGL